MPDTCSSESIDVLFTVLVTSSRLLCKRTSYCCITSGNCEILGGMVEGSEDIRLDLECWSLKIDYND
ncbi:hypothetical protein BofuT4_uP025490.1 [Botrytis cinerea T4]|uniref:Uncharacterized protein n=1 Tax=Botryotinia fuckeliana (strain T4) TaxID=999810 RepID=G2YEF2_BOTF4|nr:hypothetical protein BofuT4_uP025490.1 [Botrytis cinerea T4]